MPSKIDVSQLDAMSSDRAGFRAWLEANHSTERECWLIVDKYGRRPDLIPYLDAVEEAICFGWIDSTLKHGPGGECYQRFSPRRGPNWTELNKERARRLERLGLMTDAGRAVLPDMSPESFRIEPDVLEALKADPAAWENFQRLPDLYVRVRVGNIQYPTLTRGERERNLRAFVKSTREGRLVGNWNDGGRLLRGRPAPPRRPRL